MWYFIAERYSGAKERVLVKNFEDAAEARNKVSQRPHDSDRVYCTSAVKCVDCESFFKPEGRNGPECLCFKPDY